MIDKTGNLVSSTTGLEVLVIEHYKKVLENSEIKEDLKHIQEDKEELYKNRVDIAKANKSRQWNKEDLEIVLKYLKANKSRDPLRNDNDIFKANVEGEDLK